MDIQQVGIIGGGTIGRNIARAIAGKGIGVILCDLNEHMCKNISQKLDRELEYEITRWSITPGELKAIKSRIEFTWDKTKLKKMPIIIECIQDSEVDRKIDLFNELNKICEPNSIFISNTAVFSITEIAGKSHRPDKIIGVHFLYPVHKIKTVEMVRGLTTTPDTYERVRNFLGQIGKRIIELHESPGYISTRMLAVWMNEAFELLQNRVAGPEDIDHVVRQIFCSKYGPFQLADRLGLDTIQLWMRQLAKELGNPKYSPSPALNRLVNAGFLGVKDGRGVYYYNDPTLKNAND